MAKSSSKTRKTAAKGGSGKTERKKKTGNGHEKPTAVALSDRARQDLTYSFKRKAEPIIARKDEVTDELNKLKAQAKEEGVVWKDVLLLMELGNQEGIIKLKRELERTKTVARWAGVGHQLEMFPGEKETMAQRHYEDGRIAALNDHPAAPPDHLNQKDANVWLQGHAAGRTSLNETRIRGMAQLGEVAADIAEKAGIAAGLNAPIGTEPPSHAETH
jgi:hypothetical protein